MTATEALLTPFTDEELADKEGMRVGSRPAPPPPINIPGSQWTWLARITGRHDQYRYDREFLRKIGGEYVLSQGIYEGCTADGERKYLLHSHSGSLWPIEQPEVDALLGHKCPDSAMRPPRTEVSSMSRKNEVGRKPTTPPIGRKGFHLPLKKKHSEIRETD
jgi:hypothetical protein